jgi:hypothetical protein
MRKSHEVTGIPGSDRQRKITFENGLGKETEATKNVSPTSKSYLTTS